MVGLKRASKHRLLGRASAAGGGYHMIAREVRCGCGALNRLPHYSIGRIPSCGKCHSRLPESGLIKIFRRLYVSRVPLAVTAICLTVVWIFWGVPLISRGTSPTVPRRTQISCSSPTFPVQGIY